LRDDANKLPGHAFAQLDVCFLAANKHRCTVQSELSNRAAILQCLASALTFTQNGLFSSARPACKSLYFSRGRFLKISHRISPPCIAGQPKSRTRSRFSPHFYRTAAKKHSARLHRAPDFDSAGIEKKETVTDR
jgi:hypothetical protein